MPKRRTRRWEPWGGSYFPRSVPIKADGIKLKSKRGKTTETWWGGQWTNVLESFGWEARLARGRSYARRGQVLDYQLAPGSVTARVQGSRPTPYKVKIGLAVLPPESWDKVIDVLAARAIFAARLLSGEMPQDIEEAFSAAQLSLFPRKAGDLETSCSCPDFANPCKHIAAVYYLLGEEFDRDPFMLFRLRGIEKAALMAALRERRGHGVEEPPSHAAVAGEAVPAPDEAPPLESGIEGFWDVGPEFAGVSTRVAEPPIPHALLKRLGPLPFDDRRGEAAAFLQQAYDATTAGALRVAFGNGVGQAADTAGQPRPAVSQPRRKKV